MKGLGTHRFQQRFNAAVAAVLTLAGFGRLVGESAKEAAAKGHGHPFHWSLFKGKQDGCPAGFHCTHRVSCVRFEGKK